MYEKQFCSSSCTDKFARENMVRCQKDPACQTKFLKKDGLPRMGKWFCSEECAEEDREMKQIRREQEQGAPLGEVVDEVSDEGQFEL